MNIKRASRHRLRKSVVVLISPFLLSIGVVVGTSSLAGATTACSSGLTTVSCTSTGTLTLTGGTLSVTAPSSLAWSGTISGTNLNLYDSTTSDEGYQVNDETGTGNGWHVTLSATTFTSTGATPHTLSDTGTLSTNGSVSSVTASAAPSVSCVTAGACTVPTDTTTYPVAVTTASSPTAVTIYDTAANSGLGNIQIGGSSATNPVGWWLSVPASAYAGTYTSTLTFSIVAAP